MTASPEDYRPESPRERKQAAARELLRRERARTSLHSFALSIDIPLCPVPPLADLDEDLLGPARQYMALHHALILDTLERCLTTPFGRCMIMAPPGTAKSSYANVAAAWALGREKRTRGILTSYNSTVAERQSRRVQQIVRQEAYSNIWEEPVGLVREAVSDWAMSNESELIAAGITAGITSNRANFIGIDDPVAGREEADSELMRKKIKDEYEASVKTRLLPGGSVFLILTRWHEADLAGEILPDGWNGESGIIRCKDGMDWEVLCLQARCERKDDPLGRQLGEYIWPEFFPARHWQMFENAAGKSAQRTWGSLYQQRPTPMGNESWDRNWFKWEDPRGWPPISMMRRFVATDWAVTERQTADWCAFGAWGIDYNGEWYLIGSYEGQVDTDKSIPAFLNLCRRTQVRQGYDEKGVIHNAIAPALNKAMKKRGAWRVYMQPIHSGEDKVAKTQSFKAIASTGIIHLPSSGPDAPFAEKMFTQLEQLPAGRWDDHADMAGLAGRVGDIVQNGPEPPGERELGLTPFTEEWIEYVDKPEQKVRYV